MSMPSSSSSGPDHQGGRDVSTSARGRLGEEAVCAWLLKKGVNVVERNFRTTRGEVDIIAEDGESIRFIEVKRWNRALIEDLPVNLDKRRRVRIREVARAWLAGHRSFEDRRVSFDLALVDPETGAIEYLPRELDYI